ncbi:LuxR family transcriptional regulator [Fimbriimonas ginsengisoli Gsoil 348]|uniref:LuxR family transcriptional regulator n=1 Tax=Fimbriimonas ginsengisoli Gsoil 348 TaxID=661478 RepID=A0A068NYH4_FIMGI|nr:LuxR family transcriptional regulator [Fimbriimonas ginsengisoli Gsoil 348]
MSGRILAEESTLLPKRTSAPLSANEDEWVAWSEAVIPYVLPSAIRQSLLEFAGRGPIQLAVFDPAELAKHIPWEGLCHRDMIHGFLSIGSLRWVRQLDQIPAQSTPDACALVVWADPGSLDYPPLPNVSSEAERIAAGLREHGFHVDILPSATPHGLIKALSGRQYRLIHFSGHANELPSGAALALESGRPGSADMLYADKLAKHVSASLVVLAACNTKVFAHTLAKTGIPAVVAFQNATPDFSAVQFCAALYGGLVRCAPISEAVHEARGALARCGGEWFAPVLYVNGDADELTLRGSAAGVARPKPRLPTEDRPFLGRTSELLEISDRIRRPDSRLVTITGLGGMGKSRLALGLAQELAPEFSGGAHWIDCTAIHSEADLVGAMGAALDPNGQAYDEARLSDALAGNRALLVLDCFERLVDHADLLVRLLRSAPGFKLLVTSRRLLGVSGEYEYPLGPLVSSGRSPLQSAIDLFEQAATQAKSSFRVTRANRVQVRILVEALEAMPLAIILAAGRLRTMDLEQLTARVHQQRLQVLQRSGNDRHANMAQVVQGSFELLNPAEHTLMNECSVFHGGFDWEAAEAVLRGADNVLDGITALRENSLLSTFDTDSGLRFRILDTVREYVEGHCDPDVLAPVQLRHAEYFVRRASRLRDDWDQGHWQIANSALWTDAANFRAAVAFVGAQRNQELVRKFARSILRWYLEAGLRSDFDLLLSFAEPIALSDASNDPHLLIELRGLQGECMRREHRASEATGYWLDRAKRCEAIGEFDMAADSYTDIASLGLVLDEPETVNAMLARIEKIGSARISSHIRAAALVIQARASLRWGLQEEAVDAGRRAEDLIADLPAEPRALFIWMSLSIVYRSAGSFYRSEVIARRLIRQALELWHLQSVVRGLLELARTLEQEGKLADAAAAIVAGEMIPRHASPQARAEARKYREDFASRHGSSLIADAEACTVRRDWRSVATTLAAGDRLHPPTTP